jgi:RES domain-containing protein
VTVAWRLVRAAHQATAFDGEGARMAGGRWNHRGTALVYVADSLALAALEAFVHLQRAAAKIPHVSFRVEIPDDVITGITLHGLPRNWRAEPPPDATKRIGTDWVAAATSAVLRVPSVLVPTESNFLLNPAHPGFERLVISPPVTFSFDSRMWK